MYKRGSGCKEERVGSRRKQKKWYGLKMMMEKIGEGGNEERW